MRLTALVERPDHVCCRYRLAAFRPYLERAGHELRLQPWPRSCRARLGLGRNLRDADAVILQRRLLSGWQRYLLRSSSRLLLFDFDDAVFLRDSYAVRGMHSARRLMAFAALVECADVVIGGNPFLCRQAGVWTRPEKVHLIPTCVEPGVYPLATHNRGRGEAELVWIGSSSTLRGLEQIRPVLEQVGKRCPGARLKLICDRFLPLEHLPVVPCPWSETAEAGALAEADIGISSVPADDWSRGKCGLKVLQYMAAGLPVVANPVGVQAEMVRHGENGFLVESTDEWVAAVGKLAADPELRQRMGQAGRRRVEAEFSVAAGAALDRLARWLAAGKEGGVSTHGLPGTEVVVGGVHWHAQPELCPQLFGPDGLRLDEWLRTGRAVVVKQAPHRSIYRVRLPGLCFYLKHYPIVDVRTWLRGWLRPAKARRECALAAAVAGRRVATVTALAYGERRGRFGPADSFLITRDLDDVTPLGTFLEQDLPDWPVGRRTRLSQHLARALGEFLARLHDGGIEQNDLHPGNLLLRLDSDDRPTLFLIDLHAVRVRPALGWSACRANLVMLNRWSILRASRADRLRFWKAYTQARTTGSLAAQVWPQARLLARELEEQTWQSNRAFWVHRDHRCLESNRYYRRLRLRQLVGHAVTEMTREELAPFLADPDEPFERPGVVLLKDSRSATVAELEMTVGGRSRRVIYKRFRVTSTLDPWKALFRPAPALRSWVNGHGLRERLLPTPRPFLVLHRRRWGMWREGYLLMEKVENAVELNRFVDSLASRPPAERRAHLRRLIEATAVLIRDLHCRGLAHRDLKAANLLVREAPDLRLHLIDLVGVGPLGKPGEPRQVQNLARLHASFVGHFLLTRTDRLRFLRTYLRFGLLGREGWKGWWHQIDRATRAKIARNLRSGRPLA